MTKDDTTVGTPEETHPRHSSQTRAPTAMGVALKGLPYVSRMDRVIQEVQETTEHVRQLRQQNKAHTSCNDEHWTPLTPEDEENETCLLGMDDDPWTYREAIKAYDKPEWDQGIEDERMSLNQHKVWTLIPRSSIPPN